MMPGKFICSLLKKCGPCQKGRTFLPAVTYCAARPGLGAGGAQAAGTAWQKMQAGCPCRADEVQ